MIEGVDYSWARPGGAAIAAAGYSFAMRYMPYPGHGGKGLSPSEADDLRSNFIAIGMVYESTAGRMFDGRPAGALDATRCVIGLEALGMPRDLPVFFACDTDTDASQLALVDDYLAGVAEVIGLERTGIYAEYDVVEHCHQARTARWFWQCLAWSRGRKHPARHLYQAENGLTLNGGAIDRNEINEANADSPSRWLWGPITEDDMPDPRVDQILRILGPQAVIDDWDARGSQILVGYGMEQQEQEEIKQAVAAIHSLPPEILLRLAAALETSAAALRGVAGQA